MSNIRLSHLSFNATSDAQGVATMSVVVPGRLGKVFGHDGRDYRALLTPSTKNQFEGRFVRQLQIWADAPVAGDRVSQIQILDTGGAVPQAFRARFPAYPVLRSIFDEKVTETARVLRGQYLQGSNVLKIDFGADELFVPGELRFGVEIRTGVVLLGRVFRVNLIWGDGGIA